MYVCGSENSYRGHVAESGGVNFYPVKIYSVYFSLFIFSSYTAFKREKKAAIYRTGGKYVTYQLKCRPQDIPLFLFISIFLFFFFVLKSEKCLDNHPRLLLQTYEWKTYAHYVFLIFLCYIKMHFFFVNAIRWHHDYFSVNHRGHSFFRNTYILYYTHVRCDLITLH